MALTYTPAGQLGTKAPDFQLSDTEGKIRALKDFAGKPLVIMFICNHCPYVKAIEERLLKLGRDYKDKAHFVAICSNDSSDYPEDAPAELAKTARAKHYPFPYLIDADQETAKAYGAVCTPDLYIYDRQHTLAYRGRLDDSWRQAQSVHKQELKLALDSLLAGQPVPTEQNPSMGCSIKWKKE